MSAPLSTRALRRLETLVLPVPAAVRCRDIATGAIVGDGLAVSLAPLRMAADDAREAAAPRALTRAGGGTHIAMALPGITTPAIQPGNFRGDSGFMAQPPRPFRLRCADALSRFLPISLRHALPAHDTTGWPGWAALDTLSPAALRASARAQLAGPATLPLFSAPGRTNPGGQAEIRATLAARDADAPIPAWVLIGAEHDGALIGLGLSDANGAAVIFCAWPPLPADTTLPPPGFAWPITIRAWSHRLPATPQPDLAAILAQFDRPARLYRQTGPLVTLPAQSLIPGQPLILRTQTAAGNSTLVMHA